MTSFAKLLILVTATLLAVGTSNAQQQTYRSYRVIPAQPGNMGAEAASGLVDQAYGFWAQQQEIIQQQNQTRQNWNTYQENVRRQLQQQEVLRAQQRQYQQLQQMNQPWNYANSTPRFAQPQRPMTPQHEAQRFQQHQEYQRQAQSYFERWNQPPARSLCPDGRGNYFYC